MTRSWRPRRATQAVGPRDHAVTAPRSVPYAPLLRPPGWWVEAALVAAFVVLTVALVHRSALTGLDVALRDWSDAHRPAFPYWLARGVNILGNGNFGPGMSAPLLLSVLLAWRRRTVRPMLPPAAIAVLTGLVIVPLKQYTARPAPHFYGAVELFTEPGRISYPSGHLMNTIVWYGVFALLLAPYLSPAACRVLRFLPPCLVFVSTIYLGFHWFTDDIGGVILGVLIYRVTCRVPWSAIPLPRWLERRPQPVDRPWP
ncbi:MAG: phosphatase PAP2 family protein [Actinocatenispora sp.]